MHDPLDNPATVAWSHSNRQSDFYELPTDGAAIREALDWLLGHYPEVKLWMGVETEAGAELYLACSPSQPRKLVERLRVHEDEPNLFDQAVAGSAAS